MSNLYLHNQLAYDKLKASLVVNQRACVIQPTGTGKSYITAEFLKENPTKKFLLLTSNNYILNQFNSNFKEFFNNYDYFSYPTLLSKSFKELLNNSYDYIILDEFHRVGADNWGSKVHELLDYYSEAKVIGLTATHIRYLEEDRNIIEELFNNNVVHFLTLMECFDKGILPRPKYISTIYNIDDEFNNLIQKINKSESTNKTALKNRIIEYKAKWKYSNGADIILKKHIKKEKNFLVFCRNIDHLEEMLPIVRNWFKIFKKPINIFKVYSLHSHSGDELKKFKNIANSKLNEFNLLFSVQQLNEGLHVDNIDGVLFLRPTKSHIIYYQQLGRSLETKGKRAIVFDFVNNFKKSNIHTDFEKKDYNAVFKGNYLKTEYDKFKFSFDVIDEVKEVENIFSEVSFYTDLFYSRYNKLKIDLENDKTLNKTNKTWLAAKRVLLYENKLKPKEIKLLDDLIPLLGYDWKISTLVRVNHYELLNSIIKSLNEKTSLTVDQRSFLTRKRNEYRKGKMKKETIKELDCLIPLMGYDWKIPKTKGYPLAVRIEKLKEHLIKGGTLSKSDSIFFQSKRTKLRKNTLSDNEIKLLNELNPFLGYDWKKNLKIKPINLIEDIERILISKKEMSIREMKYLSSKRREYINNKISKTDINKLDKLIPLLGYDWKISKGERIAKERVNSISFAINKKGTIKGSIPRKLQLWLNEKIREKKKNELKHNIEIILDTLKASANFDWYNKKLL